MGIGGDELVREIRVLVKKSKALKNVTVALLLMQFVSVSLLVTGWWRHHSSRVNAICIL